MRFRGKKEEMELEKMEGRKSRKAAGAGKTGWGVTVWNPWHGCRKTSPGCKNCYVYRRDAMFGRDSSIVEKTADFDLPVRRKRDGGYAFCRVEPRLREAEEFIQQEMNFIGDGRAKEAEEAESRRKSPEGNTGEAGREAEEGKQAGGGGDAPLVYTCMTSDFFIEEADPWRAGAWNMIRERRDLRFFIITKRIHRFEECLPPDWGEGYENVTVCCTCENQAMADKRLPLFLTAPIRHREIIIEPMLGEIRIEEWLAAGGIEEVTCGGESGPGARLCEFDWVMKVREQCMESGTPFHFKQTGALFRKDGKLYHIDRNRQMSQAARAGIDWRPEGDCGKQAGEI